MIEIYDLILFMKGPKLKYQKLNFDQSRLYLLVKLKSLNVILCVYYGYTARLNWI